MIDPIKLLEIISGQRNGFLPSLTRAVAWMLVPAYRFVVSRRNRRFDANADSISKVEVPVISIGNLTTGGTGKTPLVIWVCWQIRAADRRVAIVSRGYGAKREGDRAGKPNDEAMELGQRLPDVPHLQHPQRVRSARIAVQELETQCIVMDDGFQHRHLGRDLDIVVIDATEPFGYGYLLPRGLLREPVKNIVRADFVVISRCDQVSADRLHQIEAVIKDHRIDLPIAKTKVAPATWRQFDGQQKSLPEFSTEPPESKNRTDTRSKKKVFVCCAIGNPDSFLKTVSATGVDVVGQKFLPDHHLYDRQDIESIMAAALASGATAVVCTHKDLVKIGVNEFKGVPIHALIAEVVFIQGEQALKTAIESTIQSAT